MPNVWRTPFTITLIDTVNTMVPGCGVGAGDLNGDGLTDLVFSDFGGSSVFLNQGGFVFKDITTQLGVPPEVLDMCTGVNVVDINGDGHRDIILARWRKPMMVFINKGNATFTEQARELGLIVADEVVHTATLDYNKDGMLDMYVLVYSNISTQKKNKGTAKTVSEQRHSGATDFLFAQQPDGTFKNVSTEAGILDVGMGLSATVSDINNDGWPDIYVANDFNATDIIYINNKNGTFSQDQKKWLSRVSQSSMGSDAVDINGDGNVDIISLDMLPHNHVRRISNGGPSGDVSIYNPSYDSNQVARNMVQINDGTTFYDVGYLTGIAATDWSWAVLIQDYDLDGLQDVYVSNGYFSDITNQDYTYNLSNQKSNPWKGPHLKLQDVLFRQTKPMTFDRCSELWGMPDTSASFGAAYADLDNDGDLDMVVANLDQGPFIFRNNAIEQHLGNSLQITLAGNGKNKHGIGAKVYIHVGSAIIYKEQYTTRGYESTVSDIITVGIGKAQQVDSIIVLWPSGSRSLVKNVKKGSILISEKHAKNYQEEIKKPLTTTIFKNTTAESGIDFLHKEDSFDDFKHYRLMPTRASWMGPALAVGDVNGDKLDDVVIGGAKGQQAAMYIQNTSGSFSRQTPEVITNDSLYEDQAFLLFDADGDGDNDLMVAGGGVEFDPQDIQRGIRLYTNNGKGQYTRELHGVPSISTNATSIVGTDYDGDGDIDVVIAGGIETERYPYCSESYLLKNNGKAEFTDVTDSVAPMLRKIGIVRSVTVGDINNDKRPDIILAGEWMPITVLSNTVHGFTDITASTQLNLEVGWWYAAKAVDVDADGDLDIVAGNIGLNSRYQPTQTEPIELWAGDFDDNGSVDPLITYWNEGKRRYIRDRPKLLSQLPTWNRKFVRFDQFAQATLDSILDKETQKNCYYKAATQMQSGVFVNNGTTFTFKPFPMAAQVAPILGISAVNLSSSPLPTLICTGNMYGAEDDVVRYDAGRGLVLRTMGKAEYSIVPASESGFYITGDMRTNAIISLGEMNRKMLLCALHNGTPQTFNFETPTR